MARGRWSRDAFVFRVVCSFRHFFKVVLLIQENVVRFFFEGGVERCSMPVVGSCCVDSACHVSLNAVRVTGVGGAAWQRRRASPPDQPLAVSSGE